MRNHLLLFVLCVPLLSGCGKAAPRTEEPSKIWYETPASARAQDAPYDAWTDDPEWLKALPLGNGSLGAMVFGDVNLERIQLNEESMWSGSPQQSDNPESARQLDRIRQYLFEGKYREATDLTNRTQICSGPGSGGGCGAGVQFGCFQTLGDLWLDFRRGDEPYSCYRRELDLATGIATVSYRQQGVNYTREIFVSHPDQVMAVRLSADRPASLSFECTMTRPERFTVRNDGPQLVMEGALADGKGGDGLNYMARLEVVNRGGSVTAADGRIVVEKADEVVLLLAASTDYRLEYPTYRGRDFEARTRQALASSREKGFDRLKELHRKDHARYFGRVSLHLTAFPDTIPTDRLVENARQGAIHPRLYELMFDYGRYLLIASSRPGGLPANLQGIWANKIQTPWNGDFHTDVNVEMNYWLSGVANLSELQLPLFDLIASLEKPGRNTARIQYGKRGWVVHPITNVWGYTSPGEYASWGMHTGAAAWLCQHIAEHYRFTGDRDFLARMYPVLKGAVEFYMDWLCRDPRSGKLVSGPAVSPENTFLTESGYQCQISMGPAHDQQTIRQLFEDFEMISGLLGIRDEFVESVAAARLQLDGTKIGSDGRIMEWAREFREAEPGHRHMSHLFALYPASQINMIQTPELIEAANRSIDCRIRAGGGHTGWSAAWLACLYARLQRPQEARENIDRILSRNLNPNLFTLCPPFQIDANFGVVAAMAEMLLQSHVSQDGCRIVQLLPALPEAWRDGSVRGLKARGGFEIDMEWRDGALVACEVRSLLGNPCEIRYGDMRLNKEKHLERTWKWNRE